jgi:hypothetical protein
MYKTYSAVKGQSAKLFTTIMAQKNKLSQIIILQPLCQQFAGALLNKAFTFRRLPKTLCKKGGKSPGS